MGFFICKKKIINVGLKFFLLSIRLSLTKKVSPIESNFIKEVIDKKIVFLFWCRLTAVLPSAYVEIAQTQIFGRCGI